MAVELEVTDQRIASWVLLGTGVAGISAGIVLGVLSVIEHRQGRDIQQRSDTGVLTPDEQSDYDAALAARDDFRVGSGVIAGIGLAAVLVGGALYVLDDPLGSPGPDARHGAQRRRGTEHARCERTAPSVSATPLLTPSSAGAAVTIRF